jgi:hypothetical protein
VLHPRQSIVNLALVHALLLAIVNCCKQRSFDRSVYYSLTDSLHDVILHMIHDDCLLQQRTAPPLGETPAAITAYTSTVAAAFVDPLMPAVRQHLAATPTWHRPGVNSSYNAAVVAAAAAIAAGSSGAATPDQQQQQSQELAAAGAFTLPHWLWLGDPAAAFPQWHTVAARRPAVLTAAQQRALLQGAAGGAAPFDAVVNLGGGNAAEAAAAAADAGRGQLRRRQQRTQLRQPHQQQLPPAHSGTRTASSFGECSALVY